MSLNASAVRARVLPAISNDTLDFLCEHIRINVCRRDETGMTFRCVECGRIFPPKASA